MIVKEGKIAAPPSWEIYCDVVDNFGDAGVLWRLARQLAAGPRQVTLRINRVAILATLVPGARYGAVIDGVSLAPWPDPASSDAAPAALPDVIITGFDARLPMAVRGAMRPGRPLWITVDYLSAEAWVEGCHRSPSPKADGLVEHFFYPGFTAGTGGLSLEPGVLARRDAAHVRPAPDPGGCRHCLLFAYSPSPVLALARGLAREARRPGSRPWIINLPSAGSPASPRPGGTRFRRQPFVPQADFDAVLLGQDINFVRGEDSLVRAIWAARPFIWQAWRQERATRADKIEALLARQADWLEPRDQQVIAQLTWWWNGLDSEFGSDPASADLAALIAHLVDHGGRISAGLIAWGDALAERELSNELARYAIEVSGRQL